MNIKEFGRKFHLYIIILGIIVSILFLFNNKYGKYVDSNTYNRIDSIIKIMDSVNTLQKKIDSNISIYNRSIIMLNDSISNIKVKEIITTKEYHEKIDSVTNYTDDQLRLFFAKRYNYIPE
jgi:hypothetical protein